MKDFREIYKGAKEFVEIYKQAQELEIHNKTTIEKKFSFADIRDRLGLTENQELKDLLMVIDQLIALKTIKEETPNSYWYQAVP